MNPITGLPLKINILHIPFRSKGIELKPQVKGIKDKFVSNPLFDEFGNKKYIEEAIANNPRIVSILNKHSLPIVINIEELEKLKQGHLNDTRIVAAKIYSSLPDELKKEVDLTSLQKAALLHDFGKVLIPNSILNKPGKLNPDERKIMDLHSELSYELLKNKDLDKKTLNLIKYHHQNIKGDGYPAIEKDFDYNIEAQILTTADKYTALREKRSYKNPIAKYEALEIIAKDVNKGNISQDIYTALLKSV